MAKELIETLFFILPHNPRRLLYQLLFPDRYARMQLGRKIATDEGLFLKPFDDFNCIFVHIPKAAGVSISKSLFGSITGGHTPLSRYQIIFSKHDYESYFKFTFVRNPWDRLVSAYLFLKNGGFDDQDKLWAKNNLADFDDFDSFVKNWVSEKNIETWMHFIPQYRYVCTPGTLFVDINFVGYYENLENDFDYVTSKLGINNTRLQHLNLTSAKAHDYREYYTEETMRKVADVYWQDIKLFGYDFDNLRVKDNGNKIAERPYV
jgi:hypothetical protein